jgi:hypothetical protein
MPTKKWIKRASANAAHDAEAGLWALALELTGGDFGAALVLTQHVEQRRYHPLGLEYLGRGMRLLMVRNQASAEFHSSSDQPAVTAAHSIGRARNSSRSS